MANRLVFDNNTEIGVFCKLTNTYCLVGVRGSNHFYSAIEAELENAIPVIKTSIGGTRQVGQFCIGNSNGLLLPHTTTYEELLHIKRSLPDGVAVRLLPEGLSPFGRFIACNDHVALAKAELPWEGEELITDVLGVAEEWIQSTKDSASAASDRAHSAANTTGQTAKDSASAASDRAHSAANTTGQTARDSASAAADRANAAANTTGQEAERNKEEAAGFLQQTGEQMKNMAQGAVESVKHTLGMDNSSNTSSNTNTANTNTANTNTNTTTANKQ